MVIDVDDDYDYCYYYYMTIYYWKRNATVGGIYQFVLFWVCQHNRVDNQLS